MADNRKRTPMVNVRLKSRIPRGCHVRRALFGCPEAVRAHDGSDTSNLLSISDVDVDKILADNHKNYLELFERGAKRKPLFNVEPAKNVAFRRSIVTRAIAASLPTSTPFPGHKEALSQESALNLSPIENVENPYPKNNENQHREENQNEIIQEIIGKSAEKKNQNERSHKYTSTINDVNKDLSNKSIQTTINESVNLKDHVKNGFRSVFTQTVRKEKDVNIDYESNCSDISLHKEDVFERFASALREEQFRQDRLGDREVSPPLVLPLSGAPSIDSSTSSESVQKDLRAQSVYNLQNVNKELYGMFSQYIKTHSVADTGSEKENYHLQNRVRSTSKKVKKSDLKSLQGCYNKEPLSNLLKDEQQKEKEVSVGLKSSSARRSEPKTKRKMCDQETNTSDVEVDSSRRRNKEPISTELHDDLQNEDLDEETLKNVDSVILREALAHISDLQQMKTPDERLPISFNDRRNSQKNRSVAESHQNELHLQLEQSHILISDDEHLKQSKSTEKPSPSKPATPKKQTPITHSSRNCTRKSILNANNIEYNHCSENDEVFVAQKPASQKKLEPKSKMKKCFQWARATYSETDSEEDNPEYLTRKKPNQNKPKVKSRQNHGTEADISNSDDEYNETPQKDKNKHNLISKVCSISKKNHVKSTEFNGEASINEESFQNAKNKNNSTLKKSVPQINFGPATNHKGQSSFPDSSEKSFQDSDLANPVFEDLTYQEKPQSRQMKNLDEVLTRLHRNIENLSHIERNSVMEKSQLQKQKSQSSKSIKEQPQNSVPGEKSPQKKTTRTKTYSKQNKPKEAFTEDNSGQSCLPNSLEGDLQEKESRHSLIVKDATPQRTCSVKNSRSKKSSLGNGSELVPSEDHSGEVRRVTSDAGDSGDKSGDTSALREPSSHNLEIPSKESHFPNLHNSRSRKKLSFETSTSVDRHILPSVKTHSEQSVNRDNGALRNDRDKASLTSKPTKKSSQNTSYKKPKKSTVFGPLKSRRRKTYHQKSSVVHTVSNDITEITDTVEISSRGCNNSKARGSKAVTDVLQEAYPTDFNCNDVNNQAGSPKVNAEVLSPGLLKEKKLRGRPPKAKPDKSENNPGKIAEDQSRHLDNQTTEEIIRGTGILMNNRQKDQLLEHTKSSLVEINQNLSKRSNHLDSCTENDCVPEKKTKANRRKSYLKQRSSLNKLLHQEKERGEPSGGKHGADQIDAREEVVSSTTNETSVNDGGLRRSTRKRNQTQNHFEIYQAMVMQGVANKDKFKVPAPAKKPRVTKKSTSRSSGKKNTKSKDEPTKSRAKRLPAVSEENRHSDENAPAVENPRETEVPKTNSEEINSIPSKESGDLPKKQKNKIVILDNHLIQPRLEDEAPSISSRNEAVSSTQLNGGIHYDIQEDFNPDVSIVHAPRDAEISPNSAPSTLFSSLCENERIPNKNVIPSNDTNFKFLKINNVFSSGLDHLKDQKVKVVASPSKLKQICKENTVVCCGKLPDHIVECPRSSKQEYIPIPVNGELYEFQWACASPKLKKKWENLNLAECVKNPLEGYSSGCIEIAAGATKSRQWTTKHTLCLHVLEGEAEVGIRNKSYIFKKKGTFVVPKGNEYYIRNLSQTNPLTLFYFKFLCNTS